MRGPSDFCSSDFPWYTENGMSGANLAIFLCQFLIRDAGTTRRCLPPDSALSISR